MLQIFISLLIVVTVNSADARIRMRKVKDPPRVCAMMIKDELLSRPSKPIWSTERNSLVVSDNITLVNDLGIKICEWNKDMFNNIGEISRVRFFIDEYKEVIYPYIDNNERGTLLVKVPFKTCDLADRVTLNKFQLPNCEKPEKPKKAKRQSRKKSTKKK